MSVCVVVYCIYTAFTTGEVSVNGSFAVQFGKNASVQDAGHLTNTEAMLIATLNTSIHLRYMYMIVQVLVSFVSATACCMQDVLMHITSFLFHHLQRWPLAFYFKEVFFYCSVLQAMPSIAS